MDCDGGESVGEVSSASWANADVMGERMDVFQTVC